MSIFKTKQNKKFSYQPRYYHSDGKNPYKIVHKFDDYRLTLDNSGGLKGKFLRAMHDYKNNQNQQTNRRTLLIFIILIILFLVLIEFDLSIFYKR